MFAIPAPVANAEANLKDAQTIVETDANVRGGLYPAVARPELLKKALHGQTFGANLPVYYRGSGGRADTYTVSAYAVGATYWISVVRGATYFGSTRSAKLTAPAPGDRHGSTYPWPS